MLTYKPRDLDSTGERVRTARKARRLSQIELASLAGVSQGWLSEVERGVGVRPSAAHLSALARALGVAVGDLIDEPDCPPSEADLPADLRADIAALPLDLRGLIQQLIQKGGNLPDTPQGRADFEMAIRVAVGYLQSVLDKPESTQ